MVNKDYPIKSQFHEKLEAFHFFFSASYSLSFQKDGFMNDDSVNVWAKSQFDFPELTTFTICTWVKFTYEVSNKHRMVENSFKS